MSGSFPAERRPVLGQWSLDQEGTCQQLSSFAVEVSGRAAVGPYLEQRWDWYEAARVLSTDSDILGFFLYRHREFGDAGLSYVGPTFSRKGAWLILLEAFLLERLATHKPFYVAGEIENPRVDEALDALLPFSCYPRNDGFTPYEFHEAIERYTSWIEHIHDFDPKTMTTAREGGPGASKNLRYRLRLIACDGTPGQGAMFLAELRRGLSTLNRRGPGRFT